MKGPARQQSKGETAVSDLQAIGAPLYFHVETPLYFHVFGRFGLILMLVGRSVRAESSCDLAEQAEPRPSRVNAFYCGGSAGDGQIHALKRVDDVIAP